MQEQAEEKSLNLTKFTEHFNNMSYWTRTLILQQPDAKVCMRLYKMSLIGFYAGEGKICDEVHKDNEVVEEDEQLQLLSGHSVRAGLRPNPKTG